MAIGSVTVPVDKELPIQDIDGIITTTGCKAIIFGKTAEDKIKEQLTLYTYFKNKEDIYNAVIEMELDRISCKMDVVAERDMDFEDNFVLAVEDAKSKKYSRK